MDFRLSPYDTDWPGIFEREAALLRAACGECLAAIHHVGSTSVSGMLAKPVIDILGVARDLAEVDGRTGKLAELGFRARGENGIAGRRYFSRPEQRGTLAVHCHVFEQSSAGVTRHLALRDYLRAHPEKAAAYVRIKQAIVEEGVAQRSLYQERKSAFVRKIESEALIWAKLQ